VLGPRELLEQPALLVAEVARDGHVHEQAMVSAPEALEHRHALPAQHADLARLRSRLELELDVAVERRDASLRPERRLGHRQVDVETMSLPSRTKRGSGRTWTRT
jgi:hypothetical protein